MSNDNVIQVKLTNLVTPTRAAVKRWLDAHLGASIATTQYTKGDVSWNPPVRTLAGKTATTWSLVYEDGRVSELRLTAEHTVDWIAVEGFALTWRDERGEPIHTTTYMAVA